MPSSLTSSFASAAAGGNNDTSASRRDGTNTYEWTKSRSNGATQTFRRSSQATSAQSRDNVHSAATSTTSGPYIPPHINQQQAGLRNGMSVDTRYSKDQLLNIYQHQRDGGILDRDLEDLFQGSWSRNNNISNRLEGKDQIVGPDVCWNTQVEGEPLGLVEMDEGERQLFTSSVNSTLKLNQAKDGSSVGNRKSSLSGHHIGTYNSSSVVNSRPGPRRRETSESHAGNGPLSPPESKTSLRTDLNTNTPPPTLLRRRTDFSRDDEIKLDGKNGEAGEHEGQTPFGSLRRLATGPLSAGLNGPSATPWSSGGPRSAFESMGGFGSFSAGGATAGQELEKRPGFGSARGNSRFKDLLQKSSSEDMSPVVKEKSSVTALEKLPEESSHDGQSRMKDAFRTRPYRSETNPYDDSIPRTGSAALSADEQGIEQMGFSSFGQGDSQSTPSVRRTHDGPSPTHTNPYHSPATQRPHEENGEDHDGQSSAYPTFAGGRRDMFTGASQSSGFGGSRTGLGSLGGLSTWGGGSLGSGTPVRERSNVSAAFGDPIFSPMADLQSPGGSFFGSAGFGSAGRSSRLGALFPPAMQDQMRSESRNDGFETPTEQLGGRDPFDSNARRNEGLRNLFDDNTSRPGEPQFSAQSGPLPSSVVTPGSTVQRNTTSSEQVPTNAPASSAANPIPTAQQRQMVMPDRMRWIYRDPQGNVQGPWSGLEMHDWFKAGFFTAELQVKKLEDSEYEPLAQLVRRIGNSREPFLVPQIGVPHGPPSSGQGNQWANNIGSGGGTQPPFANSFPSFGTTLTAEQQNALERRKQEEQYLMARQKEHLAQQQMYMKQIQLQNPSSSMQGLQHHSSAHSLQSQPSFGSITSPGGYHHSPMQGPIQPPQSMSGFTQTATAQQPIQQQQQQHHQHPQGGRDDELPGTMDRLSFNQRTNVPFGTNPAGSQSASGSAGQGQVQDMQTTDQLSEHVAHEATFLGQDDHNDRLEEFRELRRQIDDGGSESAMHQPMHTQGTVGNDTSIPQMPIGTATKQGRHGDLENLSLTQQVQRMAAANEKAAAQETILEPPPTSISPLPAPTPNRNRQHVADQLAAESRSQSQTPVEPSSIAPWAQAEMPKGPSLREIQEAESKRAAEQEALIAAARRAQVEQERVAAATIVVPAPGLPASSNWASSMSPSSPGPASSVWGAKQITKPSTGIPASKKTLAQIQKEEEVKKQKAAAQLAATQVQSQGSLSSSGVVGKRYAELAGKTTSTSPQATGNSWIPVGSGGKPKTPATVVAAPQTTRTISAGSMAALPKTRPALQTRTTSISNKSRADEEFIKWAKSQLSNELNAGINPDAFIRNLLELPAEKEILREALYASSQTINGDRVSEEWVRRRRLADKGIIEPAVELGSPIASDNRNAGWSEVAKKNPTKEDTSATQAFKVVSKKKGKK